jgi:MinD superfamily P-loop ATPase
MLKTIFQTKQLILLSGKGGTGKTSLSAAFAHLAFESEDPIPAVLVDADVDAANLGLVLQPDGAQQNEFWGGAIAQIDPLNCNNCGRCAQVCRYDAVLPVEDASLYSIDPLACDGCAACVYACPQDAIRMVPQQEGLWFHSHSRYGDLFHAELFPGKENSGKLVTRIKQQARLTAEDKHIPLILIDGPPGIGCPVISASAGADLALMVTEPSVAGIHDLKRIMTTLQHFRIPALICINKADLYPPGAQEICNYAQEQGVELVTSIPFDTAITRAMLHAQPVTAYAPDSAAAQAIRQLWQTMAKHLKSMEGNE